MKKVILVIVLCGFFLGGCSGSIDPRQEEIRALLNRYGNALLMGDYDLAKSCLVPSGPRDDNFDLTFTIIQNILHAEPQYSQGICSLPLFGVVIESVHFDGEWVEVRCKSRQVCGFCESTWVVPYPIPVPEYAYSVPPEIPDDVSPFNQWVCYENTFLIDTDTVLVKKVGEEWLLY